MSSIQISQAALIHNCKQLKRLVGPNTKLTAVVKANAYGHGLKEVVSAIDSEVDAYHIDDYLELVELRKHTQKRALVLGYVSTEDIQSAVEMDGELALYDFWQLPYFEKYGVNAHIEIDALLGRLGLQPESLDEFLIELSKRNSIKIQSAYSHFSNLEDAHHLEHTKAQISCFEQAVSKVKRMFPGIDTHMSATGGTLTIEREHSGYGMVRAGIGIYGLYTSQMLAKECQDANLQPALRWTTDLATVKTIPAGHPVGYSLTFIAKESMRIGIIPIGYSDGYDRGLSNKIEVLVNGQRCRSIGRIAMNMFAIDLTNAPAAKAGDEVVLLGTQGDETISAEELAEKMNTIHYEVLCRISPLLKREIV